MWFFFALTFALLSSVSLIITKKAMEEINERTLLLFGNFLTLPFLFIIIIIFFEIPKVSGAFYVYLLVSSLIGLVGGILALKAVRESEISLVSPISSFNPVFTAIISFIILGEALKFTGVLGILFIVAGSYVLQINKTNKGILAPFKALLTHKGVQMSLVAYFLWSITPIFEKSAIAEIQPSVPPFASLVGLVFSTTFLAINQRNKIKQGIIKVRKVAKLLLIAAILNAISQTAAYMAFSQTNLGYATAIFKLSTIFTVLLGWKVFKEEEIRFRLLGAAVMLVGTILLVS